MPGTGRLWAVVAAVTTVGALVVPGPAVASDGFRDVPSSHVFHDNIKALAAAGITRGCNPPDNTRFCPDDYVTRGQMAAFLDRALELRAGSATFSDTAGHLFEANIAALADADITRGCNPPDNTRFCPDDYVTRGQMAAFLDRALGLPADGTDRFTDDDGSIFEANIQALAAAGITRGCNPPDNTRFCPDDSVTRGQMAAFLTRGLGLSASAMCTHQRLNSGVHVTGVAGLESSTSYQYVLDDTEPDKDSDGFTQGWVFEEIEVYDHSGRHVGQVSPSRISKGVWATANGNRLLVVDNANPPTSPTDFYPGGDRARLFTATGSHIRDLQGVTSMATADNTRPVFANSRIYVHDSGDTDFGADDVLRVFDREGNPTGQVSGSDSMSVGPRHVGAWDGWAQGHNRIYTWHSSPYRIKIHDRDGQLLRQLDDYYDVTITSQSIVVARELSSGTTRLDVYTPDGATLLGSSGPLSGYAKPYATFGDGRIAVHILDDSTSPYDESLLLVDANGTFRRTMIAASANLYLPDVWPTLDHLYVPTLSSRDTWEPGPILIFDTDGTKVGQIDGSNVGWFRPTTGKVYITTSDDRGLVLSSDGTNARELTRTTGIDGIFPPRAAGATVSPAGGEGGAQLEGNPAGVIPDGANALPAPKLLYVRAWGGGGWQVHVHRPDGSYVETFPDTHDASDWPLGEAVLIDDYVDGSTSLSMWRRVSTSC